MDAHYNIVMKAREGRSATKKHWYFAYSGILDRPAFEKWRHEHSYEFFELPEGQVAKAVDMDLVFDFPSRWWGGRVAGLVDKKGSEVYGRLFEIVDQDWPVVQHKEGFVTGMAVERPIKVLVGGQEIEAIAFTTSPARQSLQGPISERYLQALIEGATRSGLPKEYVDSLPSRAV
jgi:cation transport regulator ChaC